MSRRLAGFGLLLATLGLVGCVDRRFVFESDPPGSMVEVNAKAAGPAPGEMPFTYYGTYRFVFTRDGYETLTYDEKVSTPWYEWFPLDFVVENLVPFTIHDVHYVKKQLQPMVTIPAEDILRRADQLRAQGQSIGTAPLHPPVAPVAPGPGAPPPGPGTTGAVPPPGPGTTGAALPPVSVAPPPGVAPPPPPPPMTNLQK